MAKFLTRLEPCDVPTGPIAEVSTTEVIAGWKVNTWRDADGQEYIYARHVAIEGVSQWYKIPKEL